MKTNASKSTGNSNGNSNNSDGLRRLFEDELKDIYWAEKALTKALPKMVKKATSTALRNALQQHLEVTQNQVLRCEKVFEMMDRTARGKKCEAMDGLIREAEEIMSNAEQGMVRDAGIISAAQKVEHYEIASYGTLCAFAETLGENDVADLLMQTLEEEKDADETLTDLAESSINEEALHTL